MDAEQVFVAIFLASLLGFGGLGSLPTLRSQVAGAGLPADSLILPALAVGNISPGPNGLYLVAVAYLVDGLTGTLMAVIALLIPPLLVLLLERLRTRLVHLRRFRSALASLALGVVAVLATSAQSLVQHADVSTLPIIFTVVSIGALMLRVPPVVPVVAAIVTGLVVG